MYLYSAHSRSYAQSRSPLSLVLSPLPLLFSLLSPQTERELRETRIRDFSGFGAKESSWISGTCLAFCRKLKCIPGPLEKMKIRSKAI